MTVRLFGRKPRAHDVEVHDVRPETPGEYEAYFAAICCSCAWFGDTRASAEEAFADAHARSPAVDPDLKRPVA